MIVEKRGQLVWPVVAILAVAIIVMTGSHDGSGSVAQAQLAGGAAGQIKVVPIQISRDSYGVAIVDTAAQTLCVYEFDNRGAAANHLRLFGVRKWEHDMLLEQYNTAEPKPMQVKAMLEFKQKPEGKTQTD